MVNIFNPLIVQNLLVHDILPYLPFLENHDDIYAAVKFRTPKDAVVSLLIELERSQELGKWQKFIDALSACGYTYIVDNIRGYKFICHKYQREYIKKLTPKLSKMILPVGLLPHLHAKDLISDSDKENILQEDMNHGHIAAAVVLLDRITRKHRNWYMLFIETLKDADMEDVAADLQIPELLEKNRTKVADTYSFDDNDLYTISPISSDQSKTCRPLSGLNVITEFATSDSKTEDHANYTSDEGYEVYDDTEYYSSPPPLLPPTIPMRPKRNVPFPDHCDLYSDQYSQRHLYNRKELNGTYFDGNDTMYEQYDDEIIDIEKSTSSFIAPGNDQQMRVNEENSRKAQNINVPEFQDLIDEIEKTKKKNNKIQLEISLLEMKYSVNEKLNCSLKRRRELRQEIEVKEREKEALESEKTCEEEESETDVNTDDYYPTDVAKCEPHSVHSLGAKRSFDYRPLSYLEEWAIPKSRVPPLQLDSEFQVVKLYSPAFEQKSTISHRFEQDSGIGADLSL